MLILFLLCLNKHPMSFTQFIYRIGFFIGLCLMIAWLSVGSIAFADNHASDDRFLFDAPHERFCLVKATPYDARTEEMFSGIDCLVEHRTRTGIRLPQEWDVVPVVDIQPGLYRGGPRNPSRDVQIEYVKTQLNDIVPYFPAGSVWVIGNEMDRPSIIIEGVEYNLQDDELPEDYAHIYHALYYHIKELDPTSSVVIGGVVQPSPLRMRYIDMILAEYEDAYGERLPTDAWHVHNMVLNEVRSGHGAGIPPGINDNIGVQVPINDNDDMERFEEQIVNFRQWMANNGYRDSALVIYEYGILMPRELGYERDRVNAFMTATFDFFMTATDENTGLPADGNRLVQQWAWYSLNDYEFSFDDPRGFNGNLLEWDTGDLTSTGEVFLDYIAPDMHVDTAEVVSDGENITAYVNVQNLGISPIDIGEIQATLVATDGTRINQTVEVVDLLGGDYNAQEIEVVFTDVGVSEYELQLLSDPDNVLAEKDETNNTYAAEILASSVDMTGEIIFDVEPITYTIFLPFVAMATTTAATLLIGDVKRSAR